MALMAGRVGVDPKDVDATGHIIAVKPDFGQENANKFLVTDNNGKLTLHSLETMEGGVY